MKMVFPAQLKLISSISMCENSHKMKNDSEKCHSCWLYGHTELRVFDADFAFCWISEKLYANKTMIFFSGHKEKSFSFGFLLSFGENKNK